MWVGIHLYLNILIPKFGVMVHKSVIYRWIMKNKRIILLLLGQLIATLIVVEELKAQDPQGYIYGRVITVDNTYEGRIRWGKEEAYWLDHFDASKTDSKKYQSHRQSNSSSDTWTNFNWDFSSIWSDSPGLTHQFSCQFGDLKSIIILKKNEVEVTLKNGQVMRLNGDGYNDIGTNIQVYDQDLGLVNVSWDRVKQVDFLPTPKNLDIRDSAPLYGTVETLRKGTFTGYIQWDHDERVGDDKLDGDSKDGDLSIAFDRIERITKSGAGSEVILLDGRKFFLTGSNDVNNENRGIIVMVPEMGMVDIPWKYFQTVKFEKVKSSGPAYRDFGLPKGLSGTVITVNNEKISGRIVYDLDEELEIEMLDGKDDAVEYKIPLRHVKTIVPKNYAYSEVELRNGLSMLLGESRDVDANNSGLLVIPAGQNKPLHIPWKEIIEITFD